MKDVVTGIRELRGGVLLTVNDQEEIRLTRKDVKTFPFKEGDAVDLGNLKHDLLLKQYPDALNRAVRLLAARARSAYEIEKRLTDACYLDDTVEMVLTRLQSDRLLDDRAFAEQWARERAARQMGRARILYELRQKGIAPELAERAIDALDPKQRDEGAGKLAAKLRKRYRSAAPADARRKTIQAMLRRGYSYAEAKRALDEPQDDAD